MRTALAIIRRVWRVVSIVVLLALVVSVPLFLLWSSEHDRALATGSTLVSTPKGVIEVASIGKGTPYLQVHGSPGGYDQALAGYDAATEKFRATNVISISRPGYLRTPLTSGTTAEDQADLYSALLDQLQVDKVVIQGSSGGAYSAIQFAIRHPTRAIALILYAPDLGSHPGSSENAGGRLQDFGTWLVTTDLLLPAIGPLLSKDFSSMAGAKRAAFRNAVRSTIPARFHLAGRLNDLEQRRKPAIDEWPVTGIRVPTLIIHGTADTNTSYQKSADLAARIPGARLVSINGGDHLAFITRSDEVRTAIDDFLRRAAPDGSR